MKMAILSIVLTVMCSAQAEILVITENPVDYTVEKKKVELGKRCVEWDKSGREPLCVKKEMKYIEIEVATIYFPEESNENPQKQN